MCHSTGMSQHTGLFQGPGQCDRTTMASATANQKEQINFILFLKIKLLQHFVTLAIHRIYTTFLENLSGDVFLSENNSHASKPNAVLPQGCKLKMYQFQQFLLNMTQITCRKCCDDRHCSVYYDQDLSK